MRKINAANSLLLRQLTFEQLLLITALTARSIIHRDLGRLEDFHWFCIVEQWLNVLGVDLHKYFDTTEPKQEGEERIA